MKPRLKTTLPLLTAMLLMLGVMACKKDEEAKKTIPPLIYFINPLGQGVNVIMNVNDTLQIIAATHDEDGTVIKVQFFIDGQQLGQRLEEPWIQGVIFTDPGSYEIGILAFDNQLLTSDTLKVTIEVIDPMPFSFSFFFDSDSQIIFEKEMTDIYAGAWSLWSRITHFSLWLDNIEVASVEASYVTLETDTLSIGYHTLYSIATDEFGVTKRSADATLTVHPLPPNEMKTFYYPDRVWLPSIAFYPSEEKRIK